MRTISSQLAASLVLTVLGGMALAAGRVEHRIARAEEALAVLDYSTAARAYAELEEYEAYERFVPWLSSDLKRLAAQRAAIRYWEGDYDALVALRDPGRGEADPGTLFIAANALYRRGQAHGADRQGLLRALDEALDAYRAVLTRDGSRSDAAFNYEYVALVRNELIKGQRRTLPGAPVAEGAADPAQTLHGREGGAPPDRPEDNQKLFVPADPDDGPDKSTAPGGDQLRQRRG